VELGYDNGREVDIADGIAGDTVVALNVGQGVRDGEPVQPVEVGTP
jgi:hypothetical protein